MDHLFRALELNAKTQASVFPKSRKVHMFLGASLVAQMAKNLPEMQETWIRSRDRDDSLDKEMATDSRTLAWKIPWMEEPGGCSPWGR